ncbi:MAG: ABC transporter ATP-binding protein [Saprospiraceae bacterium]|nr:ABC transporter ATP-binding protein [Saprospiraceae bacterium]
MTIETLIQIDSLHFGYKKGTPLFSELDLQLKGGQIYGLLGRNGAGKTTLLRIIAGLLQPWNGEVTTLGYSAFDRNAAMLADICFIPEEWAVPDMDIRDLPRIYAPFYPKFDEALFWKLVQEFELPTTGKLTGSSFGQKKKAIISFSLATKARLLILDEPTNGLDIPSKSRFRKIISSSIHDETCMLISTHQVRDMVNLIDPLIILDQGKIIFQQDLATVAQKLRFHIHNGLQEPLDAWYAERIPGGYLVVSENTIGEDTDVDLEVLFNAIIQHPDRIQKLFNA